MEDIAGYLKFVLQKEGPKDGTRDYKKRYKELFRIMEKRKKNALKESEGTPDWVGTSFDRILIENLEVKPGETFVDIFCGIGIQTVMAGQEGAKAIGIEIDKETVKLAKDIAKTVELAFADKETAENLSVIIEKVAESAEKGRELCSRIERSKELSLEEKEKLRRDFSDWMVNIFDFYEFYLELKWKDPYLDEKLKKIDLPKGVNLIQGDAVHLPLESNSADKILSVNGFHWISSEKDRKKTLKEIFRIAKKWSINRGIL